MRGYRRYLKDACEDCGFSPTHRRQLQIHHVDGDRGNDDPANLRTLCANCHTFTHATSSFAPSPQQQAILAGIA
jgi:predicted HNH restriction endonuclease